MERIGVRQQWHQTPLVLPVVQHRYLSSPFRTRLSALIAITYCNGESRLGGTQSGSRYAYTPANKRSQHRKKSPVITGNGAVEFSFFIDARKTVEQIVIGNR